MARKATNVSGHVSQSKKSQERWTKPEVTGIQDGLSESVPKVDLEAKVTELEALLSGTRQDLDVAK
ncbi:MAG TPA: hypothetical protein VJZ75_01230, partial [Candidatus Bathyarchaeia archaeon]|nr:hypothetical protein [Candidatus Bathyarchaeia archaeon]